MFTTINGALLDLMIECLLDALVKLLYMKEILLILTDVDLIKNI